MNAVLSEKMEKPVIQKWFADKGDETLRLSYPLTADSIVLDAGGYRGDWAALIHERYGCTVHVFEPVAQYFENICRRFQQTPGIHVHPCGIAERSGETTLSIEDDSSSIHRSKGVPITIQLKSAQRVFHELNLAERGVDLIKINIEGCEYELLEHFVETGLVRHLRDIQVQFHDFVPNAAQRMAAIQEELAKTHQLTWQYRFVWENWRRRDVAP